MPPLPGNWHSLLARHAKVWKAAYKEASKAIKQNLPKQAQPELQPVLVRNTQRQPLHPAARIRQSQSRWFSTSPRSGFRAAVRHFTSTAEQNFPSSAPKQTLRSTYPKSNASTSINRSAGRAPFASTLRPNLTGGALGRTAGGYSLGAGRVGGARYFSHGPASQAHVVQNVSQAVRAFFVSGQKAQFNGVNPRTGENKYKAVTALQDETGRKMRTLHKATPGSHLDFAVNPTITALTSMGGVAGYTASEDSSISQRHINTSGLLDVLSVDFSRALKDLAAVLNDLKKISQLGDMPITYEPPGSLRVHFPGCDAETVETLCAELGVQRGVVYQDEDFDAFCGTEIALLFPFAPSAPASEVADDQDAAMWFEQPKKQHVDWHTMLTPSDTSQDECYSTRSAQTEDGYALAIPDEDASNPWDSDSPSPSTPSAYETLQYSSPSDRGQGGYAASTTSPLEYQGLEGIYRFIEECDAARPRRGS